MGTKGKGSGGPRKQYGRNLKRHPRAPGANHTQAMARAALDRKTGTRQKGVGRQMTVVEVAYHQVAEKARAGDQSALAFLLSRADVEPAANLAPETDSLTEQDREIIRQYLSRHPSQQE